MPLGMEVGLVPGHIVLDGDPAPLPKKGGLSIFGPCFLWPNGWMDQDAAWYEASKVGLGPGRIVAWGPSSPSQNGHSPQFSAHVYCGQTVAYLSYW